MNSLAVLTFSIILGLGWPLSGLGGDNSTGPCDHPELFYECADGLTCIPIKWRCDESPDCPDGSDEDSCPGLQKGRRKEGHCHPDHFRCLKSGRCIPQQWVCDGEPDCGLVATPGDDDDGSAASVLDEGQADYSDEDQLKCKGAVECLPNQFPCKVCILLCTTDSF